MSDLFRRHPDNPLLTPLQWWEQKGVLNPGAVIYDGRVTLVYRAVGADGISRFGLSTSSDGARFSRGDLPVYEARPSDTEARLGIEDPRLVSVEGRFYLTYTKVCVEPSTEPPLHWETAPFRLRSWVASTQDFGSIDEVGPVLEGRNTKDLVLFPEKIAGRYVCLVRDYPSILLSTSADLSEWSEPVTVLSPVPDTWEAERVGAGPPPIRVPAGWLLLYHANEYLRFPGNRRLYRMGLALLDANDPSHVLYRHPEPVFEPQAAYETDGPVGNVVFGTGLIEDGDTCSMYYGAGDGVIALATVDKDKLLSLLPTSLP